MEQLTFSLAEFEGPLDLLLTLVRKNKMRIYDIPILELIDQYLATMRTQGTMLDASSAFIEMAARLVYMKSVFLLPKSEEAEKLRQELTGLLVEYSACREAAARLRTMQEGRLLFVRTPFQPARPPEYALHHDPAVLAQAYVAMGIHAPPPPPRTQVFEPLVARPTISVSSRIFYILRGLTKGAFRSLRDMFHKEQNPGVTVATFLALLELMKGGRVRVGNNETVNVLRRSGKGE